MKTLILFLFIFQFLFNICDAQVDTIIWQTCLGTNDGNNDVRAVAITPIGYLFGIHITENGPGVTNYHGSGEAWIISTDKIGNIIWERCYGGTQGEGSIKIINIDNRKYFLLNYAWSSDGDVQNGRAGNFWVVKIDGTGNIIWENSYGGTTNGEEVRDGILMPDHGLLLMGRITSLGGDVTAFYGQTDIWFCRIDSTGAILWEKTFGNTGMENALKINLTSYNTVVMIGGHPEPGGMIDCPFHEGDGTVCDVWILEIDPENGAILNQWCYGGTKDDLGRDIVETDSGFVFAASTNSLDGDVTGFHGYSWTYYTDFWIVKIDRSGNIIWQKCLGGYCYEFPRFITQTSDNGFICIGEACSIDGDVTGNHTIGEGSDIWVAKLSSDGQLEWNHCFGGANSERIVGLHSILKLDDYDYIIGAMADLLDGDVECDLFPNDAQQTAWLFEAKDCNYYFPAIPSIPIGPDTLCNTTNHVAYYSIDQAQWARGYEWSLEPEFAGILTSDSSTAEITWNPLFEGIVAITARSYNNCGTSAWSDPKTTMVHPCLGVEGDKGTWGQGDKGNLEIRPNPAGEIVNCRLSIADCRSKSSTSNLQPSIMIYDIFGRSAPIPGPSSNRGKGEWSIDVSSLPPGIYFVVARDERGVIEMGKFVIAR